MTEPRVPVFSAWWRRLVFCAAAAALIIVAALVMFSAFMFYDDEGYVLISLRNFAEHGHLYSEVFSQYGPFPYVFYYLLHLLGLPLTHIVGRTITLLAWSGAAVSCALLVRTATRSIAAQLAVLAAVFVYLWVMASEPSHPGGLIALVTAVLAASGYRYLQEKRVSAWGWLAGIGVAVLVLTKINVGVFAGCSAVAWFLLHHENAFVRRWAPACLLAAVIALPFALMRSLLAAEWVRTYALMFACSGVAAVGAAAMAASPRASWRVITGGIVGAALTAVAVIAVVLIRGTSLAEIADGMLLQPLRHPSRFSLDFPWKPGVLGGALGAAGTFATAWLLRRAGVASVDKLVAALRFGGAIAAAVIIYHFPGVSPDNFVLGFFMPWLWVFLWPLAGENESGIAPRNWVGLLFLGQCLHPFPVRGSQIAWGTFLMLPLIAISTWSAAQWVAVRFPAGSQFRRAGRPALQAVVLIFAFTTGWGLWQVGARYQDGRNLDLPGAEQIRLPENATALFRVLTLNAAAHADVLFSLPGMYSFNLWSERPTPTLANVTHWFSLLDEPQQQDIMRVLGEHPRACVIVQREHVNFIGKHGFGPFGPLQAYIKANFSPAFTLGDFEFCVRNGRKIAPLLLAEKFTRQDAAPATPADPENTLLKFNLLLPDNRAVASVEIIYVEDRRLPARVLRGSEARVAITPINLAGEPIGAEETKTFPFAFKGLASVSLYFDAQGRRFPPDQTLIVLHDADGGDLALVRMLH